jgi:peptidylprolyl isomerase
MKQCISSSANIFLFFAMLMGLCAVIATIPFAHSSTQMVGEAFGKKVSSQEFNYHYKTASIFTRLGEKERTDEDIREEAWQNLVFLHEAKELNITVSAEELQTEIKRLLAEKNIEYGTNDYHIWVITNFNEDAETFERRIEDLLVINKFMQLKTKPEVSVTEEEMRQKFLNQYNSFESEYIRFASEEEAEEFLKKVKENPYLWKEKYDQKKAEGQKGAAWINIMSLEALIDLWKIPKDDAYRILSHKEGEFIVAHFYYGVGVFRLLQKREADMEKYTPKKKEYYKKVLTTIKKRKIVQDYFDGLLERANLKDYVKEEQRLVKIRELQKKSLVVLETTDGSIELKLFPKVAPKACENFVGLVEKGYYDGLIFHRVIKDFMIQGGDPTGTGRGGESLWGEPFQDEVSDDVLFDRPGLLAMANSGPNTNKSQFFITVKPAAWLNKKHTIFGEVVSGFDVVKKIENASVDSNNRPIKERKILKAYLKKEGNIEAK